jgi:hypothetical protein
MADWMIIAKCSNDQLFAPALHARSYDYIIENTKTGEIKEVTAFCRKDVGERIAYSEFTKH